MGTPSASATALAASRKLICSSAAARSRGDVVVADLALLRRADEDHRLALQRLSVEIGGEPIEGRAPHLLVQLGQLARQCGRTRTEHGGEIGKRFGDARGRLEEHERRRHCGKLGDARAPAGALRRQEPGEQERVGRQPGDRQRGQRRRSARQRLDAMARVDGLAHQLPARIGDEGRAGIRYQRDALTGGEVGQHARPLLGRVMLMIGPGRRADAEVRQERAAVARVLAQHRIGARQHGDGAQGDVPQIADRGRNDVEARGKLAFEVPLQFLGRTGENTSRIGPLSAHGGLLFRNCAVDCSR